MAFLIDVNVLENTSNYEHFQCFAARRLKITASSADTYGF